MGNYWSTVNKDDEDDSQYINIKIPRECVDDILYPNDKQSDEDWLETKEALEGHAATLVSICINEHDKFLKECRDIEKDWYKWDIEECGKTLEQAKADEFKKYGWRINPVLVLYMVSVWMGKHIH